MVNLQNSDPVLIAGGGIGGMALALTLHQIGVPCRVLEGVSSLKPLGVGINLQPNAVRELYDLGLGEHGLDTIGLQAREWALVGRNGNDVYSEPAAPAGRLPLAATLGTPRPVADAAVPHGGEPARA
ncbi:MAG: FAD-dependent monooxygenase [Rubrivivax sp.]|jgi:2-polyprenyl-6-methoxyphenol hydroxylase-like FAD-dependent oxidoreductase